MCTIIGGKFKNFSSDEITEITKQIFTKGGNFVSISIFEEMVSHKFTWYKNNAVGYEDGKILYTVANHNALEEITNFLKIKFLGKNFDMLIFSRLTPEMEKEDYDSGLTQPYLTIGDKLIVAHGTIPLKSFDGNMVDTEILRSDLDINISVDKTDYLNGKIAIIEYDKESKIFNCKHNGLGLYLVKKKSIWFTNVKINREDMVTDIDPYETFSIIGDNVSKVTNKENINIVSLFSGGLDTLVSTQTTIIINAIDRNIPIDAIHLIYFDWGTNASEQEIEVGSKFLKYLVSASKEHPNLKNTKFKFDVIPLKGMFNDVLNACGQKSTRLSDPDAIGKGEEEAEEAISYVPFRNTYLINTAAAIAEARYPLSATKIIIGANLTEGMVYADNSSSYIDHIDKSIKYSGQKTGKFQVIAPFVNKTKTVMLEIAESLKNPKYPKLTTIPTELTFSCYFPVDGKACDKCGSCLLRNEAIKRSN